MRVRHVFSLLLLLTLICIAFDVGFGCASSRGNAEPTVVEDEDSEDYDADDQSRVGDEDDETSDDISLDHEDFDLMCDLFEQPERLKKKPDFIIIGAKKGGTRALLEFLRLHPRIKAAGPEIHFFDNHYEKGMEWYISQLPAVSDNQLVTEKTPAYFHTPEVPQRIKAMDPNIKLVLILRDPVKRLISDYNQFRTKNLDMGNTYPDLEELVFDAEGQVNDKYPPVQRSVYFKHMKRWFRHFPQNQIHIVNGDAFIRQPWIETQKIENFLQIEPVITENNFFFNNTKGYYCGKDIRTTGVWTCVRDKCLSKAKGRPKPPLKPSTGDKLTEFFRSHNLKFYQLVNQTFGWPT